MPPFGIPVAATLSMVLDGFSVAEPGRTLTTEADGIFATPPLPQGRYQMRISAPGYLQQFSATVPHKGEYRQIAVRLEPLRVRLLGMASRGRRARRRQSGDADPRELHDLLTLAKIASVERTDPAKARQADQLVENAYYSPAHLHAGNAGQCRTARRRDLGKVKPRRAKSPPPICGHQRATTAYQPAASVSEGVPVRVALVSDIHANEVALQLFSPYRQSRRRYHDMFGDVATLGPHPREVLNVLQERKCPCIMGNHDEFLLDRQLIERYTEAPIIKQSGRLVPR